MKSRNILVALCVVVFATSLVAQRTTLRADIPFQFYVGDKVLPAGHYNVLQLNDSAMILQLSDTSVSRAFTTHSTQRDAVNGKPVMIFRQIGGTYFLSQVWKDSGSQGRELPVAKVQTQIAREGLRSAEVVVLMARK